MFDRKKQLMERIRSLPAGSPSPSGRYWCVTCKKLFRLDAPVCPYMTAMCVNTPIAIENFPPESTEWLEKTALFYPKIPQRVLAGLLKARFSPIGREMARAYLDFLEDWKIEHRGQLMQTLKSFVLIVSGCETAQRVSWDEVTFVVTDLSKIWDREVLFSILRPGLEELAGSLGVDHAIKLDSLEILGERDMGKYFCGMCRKFFEFGLEREKVTCPLMAQKCMFDPVSIRNIKYGIADLIKVFTVSPDIPARFFSLLPDREGGRALLGRILKDEWAFEFTDEELGRTAALLGLDR